MIISIYHQSWLRHWITITEVVRKNQKAAFEMRLLDDSKFCKLIIGMIGQFGVREENTRTYKVDMELIRLIRGIHKIARYSNFSIVPRNLLSHKDIKEVKAILDPLIARADINDFSRRVSKH